MEREGVMDLKRRIGVVLGRVGIVGMAGAAALSFHACGAEPQAEDSQLGCAAPFSQWDLASHGVSIGAGKAALELEPGVEAVLPEDMEGQGTEAEAQEERKEQRFQEPEGLRESLEGYFTEFYRALWDDSKECSSEEFATTDGYIAAKILASKREMGKELYGGISDVELQELCIDDIFDTADRMEVMVYVEASFCYNAHPKESEAERDLYRVAVVPEGKGYRILDLESSSADAIMVKEALGVWKTPDIERNYEAVDAYWKEYK